MPVYNKRGILLLPKVIVLNPKDGSGINSSIDIFLLRNVMFPRKVLENIQYVHGNIITKKLQVKNDKKVKGFMKNYFL